MRVCFVSPYPPEKDGVAIYTKRVVDNMPLSNDEILVITKRQIILNEPAYIKRMLSLNITDIHKVWKTLVEFKPDIIHVQYSISMYGFFSFVLLGIVFFMKLVQKTKTVVTFHEVKRELDLLKIGGRFYFLFLSFFFDQIIVHTKQAKQLLQITCKVKKPVSVIPLGSFVFTDTKNKFAEVKSRYGISTNYILYFGFIHVDKGIDYLIRAFHELLTKDPTLKQTLVLLIVGSVRKRKGIFTYFGRLDEAYYIKLQGLTKAYELKKNIIFIPYIPDGDVYTVVKNSISVVLPYTNTEQSGVLNIAIAAEKPVIASDIGGMKETLENIGVLVHPRDTVGLSNAMEKLITDKKLYRLLEKKYAILHKELSIEYVIGELMDMYRKLLN